MEHYCVYVYKGLRVCSQGSKDKEQTILYNMSFSGEHSLTKVHWYSEQTLLPLLGTQCKQISLCANLLFTKGALLC